VNSKRGVRVKRHRRLESILFVMGAGTLVSEDQYLHTAYKPDCEYEDGVLIERNVGTRDHSRLQAALAAYFFNRRTEWNIHVYTEQRFQRRIGKYMIPDICVIQGPEPQEQVFVLPPLLWIEILSPEDRPIRVNRKVREALDFGTPYVWVIDPESLESELHTAEGHWALDDGVLRIPGSGIEVPLNKLYGD
jgi:Uma2 family endonuclease